MSLLTGLIAHYRLDGNGVDAVNGNNCTSLDGVTYVSGKLGAAASFNGSNSLYAPNQTYLQVTTALSFSLWFKTSAAQTNNYIMAKGITGLNNGWDVCRVSGGLRSFLVGLTPNVYSITATVNDNQWHHYVLSFGSGSVKIYLDGINLLTNNSVTGTLSSTTSRLGIGAFSTGSFNFIGQVDQVRIYNRALSADEVQLLFKESQVNFLPLFYQ